MSINWERLGLGAIAGYIITSLLIPHYRGFQALPEDTRIGLTSIHGGGPSEGISAHSGGGGGGGMPHGGIGGWPKSRAYGGPAVQWPGEFGPENPSKCTPEDLDCGASFTCAFHKSMCALGIWK